MNRPPAPRRAAHETFRPAGDGETPGALIPGEGDAPSPIVLTAGDDHERVTRRGLRCPTCREATRIELDIISGREVVITLQGCTTCRSGLCRETGR